jgi:hypothetical protein
MTAFQSLRRGVWSMRFTSRVPRPTAAGDTGRRFTFAFQDSPRREVQAKRRLAIAEYLDGWAGAEIVGEHREGDTLRCYVTFTTTRAVPVEIAEQFVAECPHVVPDTFAACG